MKRRTDVLDAVMRASARSASVVHGKLKRGLSSLASIAATAPLIGLFGTFLGVFDSIRGGSTERSTVLPFVSRRLTESLFPTALGIIVAVLALFCYGYLIAKIEQFDLEMKDASLELTNELARLPGLWPPTNI